MNVKDAEYRVTMRITDMMLYRKSLHYRRGRSRNEVI